MGVKEVLNYFGIVDMYLYFRLIRPGLTYHHTVARQLLTTNF